MENEETDYAALAGKLAGHLANVSAALSALYDVYSLDVLRMPYGARALVRDAKEWSEAGKKLFPETIRSGIITAIAEETEGR